MQKYINENNLFVSGRSDWRKRRQIWQPKRLPCEIFGADDPCVGQFHFCRGWLVSSKFGRAWMCLTMLPNVIWIFFSFSAWFRFYVYLSKCVTWIFVCLHTSWNPANKVWLILRSFFPGLIDVHAWMIYDVIYVIYLGNMMMVSRMFLCSLIILKYLMHEVNITRHLCYLSTSVIW